MIKLGMEESLQELEHIIESLTQCMDEETNIMIKLQILILDDEFCTMQ